MVVKGATDYSKFRWVIDDYEQFRWSAAILKHRRYVAIYRTTFNIKVSPIIF